jgi:hypothetical protein
LKDISKRNQLKDHKSKNKFLGDFNAGIEQKPVRHVTFSCRYFLMEFGEENIPILTGSHNIKLCLEVVIPRQTKHNIGSALPIQTLPQLIGYFVISPA